MTRYHCCFDDAGGIILIADDPKAMDLAPYDRIARRGKILDAGLADLALQMHGGEIIESDGLRLVSASR